MLSFNARFESSWWTWIRGGCLQGGSLTIGTVVEKTSCASDSYQVHDFLITEFRVSFCCHFSLGHESGWGPILITADTICAQSWRIARKWPLYRLFRKSPIALNLFHELFMGRLSLFHGDHRPLRVCRDGRIPHSLPGLIISPAYQGATWLLSKFSIKFGLEIEFHIALTTKLRVAILDKIWMFVESIVVSGYVWRLHKLINILLFHRSLCVEI